MWLFELAIWLPYFNMSYNILLVLAEHDILKGNGICKAFLISISFIKINGEACTALQLLTLPKFMIVSKLKAESSQVKHHNLKVQACVLTIEHTNMGQDQEFEITESKPHSIS